MTGPHADHDAHTSHSVTATVVALLIVALFSAVFAAMAQVSFGVHIAAIFVILAFFSLMWIWVLDSD
ncbi:MAG: hypothetical protein GC157_02540 [Frankiales bacterium]|nr:hypothetical protein [Frankiales bacterium]